MTDGPAAAPETIESWHAHVYFDGATADRARVLYGRVQATFPAAEMGRFHEKPVGPHPMWSYQVAFTPELLAAMLTSQGLDIVRDRIGQHASHPLAYGEIRVLARKRTDRPD